MPPDTTEIDYDISTDYSYDDYDPRDQDPPDHDDWRPCCSRMNIDCCGHDDDMDAGKWEWSVVILSPNYCDGFTPFDIEPPF